MREHKTPASQTLDLSLLSKEVRLSDPQISPSGRFVVVVASRPDYGENRFVKSLELIDIMSGATKSLNLGIDAPEHPRWSPDGELLAFLGKDEQEEAQIHVTSPTEGSTRRVTSTANGVVTFAWRPDGGALAYVADAESDEGSPVEPHNRSFEVGDNSYLADRASTPLHIWVVAVEGGPASRITHGNDCFCRHFGRLSWSPSGLEIAFTNQSGPDSGAITETSIRIVNLESGLARDIGQPGLLSAQYAPYGDHLALCRPRAELGFSPAAVYLGSSTGTGIREMTADLDRDFQGFGPGKAGICWMDGGDALLLWANDGTDRSLWFRSVHGSARPIDLHGLQPTEVAAGPGGCIAVVASTPTRPSELYWFHSTDAKPLRFTHFNDSISDGPERKAIGWKGPDGFSPNGVVTYPSEYRSGSQYPLVLELHGGPMSASTIGFSVLHRLMAEQGWIVFSPNYRGSNNLGLTFQRSVINDAGDGPSRDVMSGIEVLKRLGIVDETRMAVSGWSYGGFLTAWLAAHHNVWRSAVAGAAVSSWIDWYNLSDLNVWCALGLGGSPWRDGGIEHYLRHSAISHASSIRTPTLLMSLTGDQRVSITQSYKLYHALKDNGTEVSFTAYPVKGHFPDDPVHERDVYRRWIGWIKDRF